MIILIQTRDGRQMCVNSDHIITVDPQEGGCWLNLTNGKRLSLQMEPAAFLNEMKKEANT